MFYFFQIAVLLIYALMYLRFREGIFYVCTISRKKRRKGFKNFWLFEKHHQIGTIGKLYYVNKFFFIGWCLTFALTLCLGYLSFMEYFIAGLIGLLSACLIPMYVFDFLNCNRAEYGEGFVLLRRRKHGYGGYDSSIVDLFACFLPAFVVFFNLFYLLKY